ncbi:flavodoxin domain-containing protein [Vallitalea okinawensis]|uniref:flavodoxin domain-containing protein n=1 Tax=Vallitalea okinawensis TaxID=2078660 RepID=UPI000CFB7CE3|nr:flavodoxin domain-containing protein [Vallitalea okinawensis]
MKTLMIYATKHGGSKKCVSLLSDQLIGEIDQCNLKSNPIPDLQQYDKVIIGGSIYAGSIQKEVSEFCNNHIQILEDKKVGLFISCMQGGDLARNQLKESFPDKLIRNAVVMESLGGVFDFKDMNFFEKLIIKMVTKNDKGIPVKNDAGVIDMISDNNIQKFAKAMNNA